MSVLTILMKCLAEPLGKFLLKKFFGEAVEGVGGGLLGIAAGKLNEYEEQREAERQFARIGERIVKHLLPLFDAASRGKDINIEAVAGELRTALDGRISAEFFLERDLDPVKLTEAFRAVRSLPGGQYSAAEEALYDRALSEAVRYLVGVAARLPRFQASLAAQSLQRLRHMGSELDEVLHTVRRIEERVAASDASDEHQRYEADYRQAVIRNLDYVELFGADISPEARRHSLSVAYISLNLETARKGGARESRTLLAEHVFDGLAPDSGRLLIRGEAGTGKSTLFRWAAIAAATPGSHARRLLGRLRDGDVELPEGLRDMLEPADLDRAEVAEHVGQGEGPPPWMLRVPFLILLRNCPKGRLPKPADFPELIAKEVGNPPSDWVKSILEGKRALVLIDGIDEVPQRYRESAIRREVEALVKAYPDNYFVISTRPSAVCENWLGDLGFREARINPMSDVDKGRFIDRWHEAVRRQLVLQGRPDAELAGLAAELKRQLPDNPPISRLAANPLLCAMICALHRDRQQKLPETQSELCEALCHMLLHRRELESGLDLSEFPEAYRSLQYEQKRALVQDIAHYMVRNEEVALSVEQADRIIERGLKDLPGAASSDAQEVRKGLVERSGVIREARPGAVDFIHNTIKEFLAADRFVENNDLGELAGHAADASWQPVILFAVATRKRRFATELVRKMLERPVGAGRRRSRAEPDVGQERDLLALRCRAAALHLDRELEKELAGVAKAMFPPMSMAAAEALAASGDAAVPFLRYSKRLNARKTAASVRALRLIGTASARRALKDYARDRRQTVLSELAQAINPLEIDVYREAVSAGQGLPGSVRAQVSDVRALAGLSKLETLDLSGTRVSDVGPLAGLTDLQTLDLSWAQVSHVGPLAGLTDLQRLDLSGARVSDVGPLAGLTDLQMLDLSRTWVSDVGPLAGLTKLRTLYLMETRVSDVGPLAGLTDLQKLHLMGTQVSDVGPLAGLTKLQTLHLTGTQVSDVGPLAGLTKLQTLHLIETQVSDVGPLAGLTDLQKLGLSGAQVSDIGPLAGLTKLQRLDLSWTQVSDVGPLAGLTDLQMLDLSRTHVSDVGPLAKLKHLKLVI